LTDRHIPPALDRIVGRCLEKDPQARFQTASDLAFALEGLSSTTKSEQSASGVPQKVRSAGGISGWVAAAGATALLLMMAVPAVVHLRERPVVRELSHFEIVTPPSADPLSFAISPDGRQLAFVANTDGGST